jgi:hypothetical protein
MPITLANIPRIHLAVPPDEGLYINTFHNPMGRYELWVWARMLGGEEHLYMHGFFNCSEYVDPDNFIRRWLDRVGISYSV